MQQPAEQSPTGCPTSTADTALAVGAKGVRAPMAHVPNYITAPFIGCSYIVKFLPGAALPRGAVVSAVSPHALWGRGVFVLPATDSSLLPGPRTKDNPRFTGRANEF